MIPGLLRRLLPLVMIVLVVACERRPEGDARPVMWGRDVSASLAQARATGAKGVMVDVVAQWCAPCKELALLYERPAVRRALDGWVRVRLDATRGEPSDPFFAARWSSTSLPLVLFLAPDGSERARIVEYLDEDRFIAALPR